MFWSGKLLYTHTPLRICTSLNYMRWDERGPFSSTFYARETSFLRKKFLYYGKWKLGWCCGKQETWSFYRGVSRHLYIIIVEWCDRLIVFVCIMGRHAWHLRTNLPERNNGLLLSWTFLWAPSSRWLLLSTTTANTFPFPLHQSIYTAFPGILRPYDFL